jgi:putative transposase
MDPNQPQELPQRKHPTHGVLFVEGQPTIIYDTVCTKGRIPWLACEEVHLLLREVWMEATAWLMGRYIIMPDHIHYFAAATENPIEYDKWVQYWKSQFSKRHKVAGRRWLTDHWDVRMRNGEQYEEKWLYVRQNAFRHELVARPEDWPYQGEIYELPWT